MDYGRPLEFGLSIAPNASELAGIRASVAAADRSGLDLVGIQDHPYQWRFLDTWMLMATVLAETERLRVFADVTNLPLRPPAVLREGDGQALGPLRRRVGQRADLLRVQSYLRTELDEVIARGRQRLA